MLALVLVLLGALVVPAVAAPAAAAKGRVERGTYPKAGVPGARDYALYVPGSLKGAKKAPLVVYLHGCNQDADDAAAGVRLNEIAEKNRFLVLYPEQRRPESGTAPVADGNGSGCWNWFLPEHQVRGTGEPATLAGMTMAVAKRFSADARRTFVAGASAGADMATILATAYPDVYAAVAPIAGCAYRTCSDVDGTAARAAMGTRARVVPAFVVQGSADMVNNAAMGATALRGWLATNDLADNGQADGSVPRTPTSTTHVLPAQQGGGPGDPCIGGPPRLPCAGGAAGLTSYPYTELRYDDARGRSVVVAWVVHGANHAVTGGSAQGSFTDPVGPGLAAAMWDFFRRNPRP